MQASLARVECRGEAFAESPESEALWSGLGEAPAGGPKGAGAPLAALGYNISGYFLVLKLIYKSIQL